MNESIRKHYSHMMPEELLFFTNFVKDKEWIFNHHVQKRIKERGGLNADILEVLQTGQLIEYHQRNGASRLLFRGERIIHKWVPCVVVELLSRKVITVYWNHKDDHHRTIDMEKYEEELDILNLFKGEEKHGRN